MLLSDVVNQRHLEKVVRSLYPNEEIHTNTLKEIKNPITGTPFEIDVWVPSLQLCFEFQDIYHYSTIYYARSSLQNIQDRDYLKREELKKRKETLIIVPYWWIGDSESLRATIQFQRPDLAINSFSEDDAIPIPFNPLPNQWNTNIVPDVGELMLVAFLEYLFLTTISGTVWWIGEKYDGIRFCWHPGHQIAYSRNGIPLSIAPNLKRTCGNIFIDGEFWSGRGLFQESFQLIHPNPQLNMALLRLIAFDIPSRNVRNKSFEVRYSLLLHHIPRNHPAIIIPGRIKSDSKDLVLLLLREILEFGGEGIILCKLHSKYKSGRSTLLYKIKTATTIDEEALVVKSTSTHVMLQLPNGDTFRVPHTATTSQLIKRTKKGDVVTISSSKRTQHHIPLDPIITRVREDITWEQVLANYNLFAKAQAKTKLQEYSKSDNCAIRSFFEKFAKAKNFDPLVASNWYKVPRKHILMEHRGEALLKKYRGSFVNALIAAFPNIGLVNSKFLNIPVNFWKNQQNQRNLVMELARQSGFDPLIAENWYLYNRVMAKKLHDSSVLQYYSGNRTKAIHHLFPDIGLDESRKLFGIFLKENRN